MRASLTIFELSNVTNPIIGRKARLNAALHSKLHFKRKRGESERWCRSSAGCERVQALAGEKRAKKRWTLVANRYTQYYEGLVRGRLSRR